MNRTDTTSTDEPAGGANTDEVILRALSQQDGSAFEMLVDAYQLPVQRLAGRLLGWSADAQDVTQDVFLAALGGLKGFRGQSGLWTWLARITINTCRRHQRRNWLYKVLLRRERWPAERLSGPPGQGAEQREEWAQVQQAMRRLSSSLREVVVLHYLQELPAVKVGEILRISESAVTTRLHRARARLRELLAITDVKHE